MNIQRFSEYLQKLEKTSKRLEITDILTDLIRKLSEKEIDKAIYLSQGVLKAPFENPSFSVAEKMIIRVLELVFEIPKEKVERVYSKTGDLGSTVIEITNVININAHKITRPLSISQIYTKLLEIATISGTGSQDLKVSKLAELLKTLPPISAKYIVRIVLGTTRLGFTELTIIDALSNFLSNSNNSKNDLKDQIEAKYNIHPDLGYIAKQIKKEGIKGIKNIKMVVGIPIWPQKCQRLANPQEAIEKMQKIWAEYKFDGTRVQLHMDRNKRIENKEVEQMDFFAENKARIFVKTYTRNLEETTNQYPDIAKAADEQIKANSVILDGEAIGYNPKTGDFLPFQEIMQRKRKHGIAEKVKEIPLKYFVFDILYLDGKDLLDKTLSERRSLLKKLIKTGDVIEISKHIETQNVDELSKFFAEAKEKNLEGLILKKPDSVYQAGARAFTWVKLKKADEKIKALQDTVDCVVLGTYFGKGTRSKFGIGNFLVGIFDRETKTFKTFTKVGTGLTDEEWIYLKDQLDKLRVSEKPKNVEVDKTLEPDMWVEPKFIVELGGDEVSKSDKHTSGYALRFPRLIKFRQDKKAIDTTDLEEIKYLYNSQKRGYL